MHENVFANVGDRAKFGAMVEGRNIEQYWLIEETHDAGRYTCEFYRFLLLSPIVDYAMTYRICPTDVRLFWALEVREVGTPVRVVHKAQVITHSSQSEITSKDYAARSPYRSKVLVDF